MNNYERFFGKRNKLEEVTSRSDWPFKVNLVVVVRKLDWRHESLECGLNQKTGRGNGRKGVPFTKVGDSACPFNLNHISTNKYEDYRITAKFHLNINSRWGVCALVVSFLAILILLLIYSLDISYEPQIYLWTTSWMQGLLQTQHSKLRFFLS